MQTTLVYTKADKPFIDLDSMNQGNKVYRIIATLSLDRYLVYISLAPHCLCLQQKILAALESC